MSNLILPKEYTNPVLENNLKLFFMRYPHERTRLEPILRKPAPNFPLVNIETPAAPSKPPIRILCLLGIANPQFLAQLLNDPVVQQECFRLFIFENDPEFLAFCFQQSDLTQIINLEKTEWLLMHTIDSVKPALFRALKPEAVTSMLENVHCLEVALPKTEEIKNFYSLIGPIYNETKFHVLHNHGNLDDSLLGVEVTLRNKRFLLDKPGILDLKDYYKGRTAVVVGAGPSLDRNLETLKKYNDRYVIIAADAALKPLLKAGIRVDYCTSIERLNAYQKPFFEDLGPIETNLIAFPVVHPEVLDMFPGPVRLVYRNYSFYAYFEKAFPKGIVKCGGSTAHLGVRLADYFGCSKMLLVGLDSTYEEKDGLYRSHCSGTGHAEWGEFVPLEKFAKERKHTPPMEATTNDGQKAVTNITYYQWIKEYSEELSTIGQRMKIVNCSNSGLKIDGVNYMPLEEVAKNLDFLAIEPAKIPAPTMTRSWNNNELIKNLEGWLELSKDGFAESNRLLEKETITPDEFNALFYLFNFRCVIDSLFVAFIIQCCATRFFQLENRWFSYDLRMDVDLKEKTAVMRDRFNLFEIVLTRLVKLFREGENGI